MVHHPLLGLATGTQTYIVYSRIELRIGTMDPISAAIITAIAAGATAAMTDVSATAVKDAYNGLKELISRKFTSVDLAALERKPDSESRQAVLADELAEIRADQDDELLAKVAELQAALKDHPPRDESGHPLINLEKFEAASFVIKEAVRDRQMLRAKDTKIGGQFSVEFSKPETETKNA
jgi:hypothetical protein